MNSVPVHCLLGVQVNALSQSELLQIMRLAVDQRERIVIANHNLNSVRLYHRDEMMRAFYSAAHYTHIDGMSLVILGRALGLPLRRDHRVTYVDWVDPIMRLACEADWRVFYLGSKEGVTCEGARVLRERHPGLKIHTHHGYFDTTPGSDENERVLQEIRNYAPQVLFVGMGMPRQEKWILQNLLRLSANVILPCGACIDYIAGAIPTPPRWMGRIGLEWLYRLATEPRRLSRRYLVEPWPVLGRFVREWLKQVVTRKAEDRHHNRSRADGASAGASQCGKDSESAGEQLDMTVSTAGH